MNCPNCSKPLRLLQVEKMLGNSEYSEWCRKGYCSSDCFEHDDKKEERPAILPGQMPLYGGSKVIESDGREPFRASRAYDLASICLFSGPLVMIVSFLAGGAYAIPIAGQIVSLSIMAIMIIGVVSGVCAICAIPKLGPQRLLWKSIIGLMILIILIGGMITAVARASV